MGASPALPPDILTKEVNHTITEPGFWRRSGGVAVHGLPEKERKL